jgi:hypothetical protein
LLQAERMEKVSFQAGDIILYDGLYGCGTCDAQLWGVAGRRLPRLGCGHDGDWRLIRRRLDRWW